jgi:hypothetical protein
MNERFGAGFLRLLSEVSQDEVSQEKLHCLSKASCAALGSELSTVNISCKALASMAE